MSLENNPIRVVLDTNVLVSAFSSGGVPAKALQVALSPICELVISDFILEELERVLVIKLNHGQGLVNEFLLELQEGSTVVNQKEFLSVIKEKVSDNRILEVAVASDAMFLVTGDRKHILPLCKVGSTRIIPPKIFIHIIEEL